MVYRHLALYRVRGVLPPARKTGGPSKRFSSFGFLLFSIPLFFHRVHFQYIQVISLLSRGIFSGTRDLHLDVYQPFNVPSFLWTTLFGWFASDPAEPRLVFVFHVYRFHKG